MDSRAGLTLRQVQERIDNGQVNTLTDSTGRSVWDIVRANVFTRINVIIGILLIIVLATGSWKNALFGLLIIANSGVGIIQEIRAKKTLESLSIVSRAKPTVIRDGQHTEIDRESIVLDDLIVLGSGDQIAVDGTVTEATGLEVDESMLTGESDPMVKQPGDTVYSGAFVVSGSGTFTATAVGADAYASQLAAEASKFTLVDSELRNGINSILKVIGYLLIPTGILTIFSQLFVAEVGFKKAVLGMVAALVPMVPEGLVLMTSVAFAVGVIRLGKRQCLVQELPAIEGLARVDVVCADKTGTLTQDGMTVREVIALPGHDPQYVTEMLRQLVSADKDPNSSMESIQEYVGHAPHEWRTTAIAPFSSAKKWSGMSFDHQSGTNIVLGAPDVLAAGGSDTLRTAESYSDQGLRVLLVGQVPAAVDSYGDADMSSCVTAVGLVIIAQKIRPDAADTINYFRQQQVDIKVISGDNARSVAAVTKDLAIGDGHPPVDARTLPSRCDASTAQEFDDTINQGSVFGRVTPEQKRDMVSALQSRGRTVAMTGDGVNDVLALKNADIGVAMGSGSQASRSVAQLVLLDNAFSTLPHVVAEGRRVIGNIERVAMLFLTKTIYSVVLALLVSISMKPFPFEPLHITIVGWFTIGIPAFLLSLAPNTERARRGFVRRVMMKALPAGLIIGLYAYGLYMYLFSAIAAGQHTFIQVSTAVLTVVIAIALWVLITVARPYEMWKVILLVVSVASYVVMFTQPWLANFFTLDVGSSSAMWAAATVSGAGIFTVSAVWWTQSRFFSTIPATEDHQGTQAEG